MKILKTICAITLLVSSIIVPIKSTTLFTVPNQEVQAKPAGCQATVNSVRREIIDHGVKKVVLKINSKEINTQELMLNQNPINTEGVYIRSLNTIVFDMYDVNIGEDILSSPQLIQGWIYKIFRECQGTGIIIFGIMPTENRWVIFGLTNDGEIVELYWIWD